MRGIKITTSLIMVLPLVVLAVGATRYVAGLAESAMHSLPGAISSLAAERINGEVKVGRIETFPAGVVLHDVVVTPSNQVNGRPLLKVPSIRITADVRDLVMGKIDPVKSIKRIDVTQPDIYIERRTGGVWNVSKLLKPSKQGKVSIEHAVINVTDAKVVLRDQSCPGVVAENRASDVSGTVTLGEVMECDLAGRGVSGKLGAIRVVGRYATTNKSYSIDLDAHDADAKYWSAYPAKIGLDILGGKAHVLAHLGRPIRTQPIRYWASVDVGNGAVKLGPIDHPFTDLHGKVEVSDGVIGIKVNGQLGRTPFAARGYTIGLQEPRLMITASADRADLKELAGYMKFARRFTDLNLPHAGRLDVRVFGATKSLAIGFDVGSPSLAYAGHEFNSAEVKGVYFDKRVRIDSANANLYGGRLQLGGDLDVSDRPSATITGSFKGLEIAQIPAAAKFQSAGRIDGVINAVWRPGNFDVHCQGSASHGQVGRYAFENASIAGGYTNGDLEINEFGASTFGGRVAAAGSIRKDGTLHLQVAGTAINLSPVARMFWTGPVAGHGQFSGTVDGSLEDPIFKGQVEGYHAVVSGIGLDRVYASLQASRKKVDLSKVVVYDYPGDLTITGSIDSPFSTPSVNLNVQARNISIEKYANRLQKVTATGSASGNIQVSGALKNLKAEGALKVEAGSISSVAIDLAEASFAYESKHLSVKEIKLTSGKSSVIADAEMLPDGGLSGKFKSAGFPLGRLNRFTRQYASISGIGDVSGTISGTRANPVVAADFACPAFAVNGERLGDLTGSLTWRRGGEIGASLNLVDGKAEYIVKRLAYNPVSQIVSVDAGIRDGDGAKLVQVASTSPFVRSHSGAEQDLYRFLHGSDGSVSGLINVGVSGDLHLGQAKLDPDLKYSISVADMKYGEETIKSLQVEGSWRGDIVNVQKLEAMDGDTNISADGSLGGGLVDLRLDAHNFSLDALRPWIKLPDNFSGRADVTLIAKGNISSPNADMSVEFVDPVLAGVKFDRLRTRLSTVGGNSADSGMRVDELTLVLGDHGFRASGFIPVDWKSMRIPTDRAMSIESTLDAGSMNVLSAMTGMKFETGEGGSLTGSFKLTGTAQTPELQGNLTWTKGVIRIPRFDSALQNVTGKITLKGDRLSVDGIMGSSSDGGTFQAKGDVKLSGTPIIDGVLRATALRLSGRNLSNKYGESVSAVLNADVQVSGDPRSPKLSGKIDVLEGSLEMPGKTLTTASSSARSIDPQFDLKVTLGKKVEFRSSRLRAPLYGAIKIAGSLAKPEVDGSVDISNGRILFPMRQMRILPGSNLSVHVSPPDTASTYVDMTAEGQVSSVTLTGQSRNYTVDMVANGPLDKLDPQFSSSPGDLSQQDIIGLLTGKNQLELALSDKGNSDLQKVFQSAVVPTLIQTVGTAFGDALGLDEFGVETGYNEPMKVTIGNRLWGGLYIDYSRVMGARPDYTNSLEEFRLSYRFRKGLEVDLATDENMILTLGVAGRRRF